MITLAGAAFEVAIPLVIAVGATYYFLGRRSVLSVWLLVSAWVVVAIDLIRAAAIPLMGSPGGDWLLVALSVAQLVCAVVFAVVLLLVLRDAARPSVGQADTRSHDGAAPDEESPA